MEESEKEKRPDTYKRHGGLLRDILEGEVGKKRGRPRLEYFDQIIRDMGCETFKEVKGMGQSRVVVSNQSCFMNYCYNCGKCVIC